MVKVQMYENIVNHPLLDKMFDLSLKVQKQVCDRTSQIDGSQFKYSEEEGSTPDGRFKSWFNLALLEDSRLFEKASFVVSDNYGKFTKEIEESTHEEAGSREMHFHAKGFSMVFHSKHPMIPSTRIHYHLIVREDGFYWFSGGGDLTPYYIFEEDCVKFHKLHKDICDKYLGPGWYQKMKEASDRYFFIKHRNHLRGVGGTFFDNFSEESFGRDHFNTGQTMERLFDFCEESCKVINDAYNSIVDKRQHESFDEKNVEFMELLRGRYTEFDLIYDRGIIFGIKSGMPVDIPLLAIPNSRWAYKWEQNYLPGSREHKTLEILYHPRNWV